MNKPTNQRLALQYLEALNHAFHVKRRTRDSLIAETTVQDLPADLRELLICHHLLGQTLAHIAGTKGVDESVIAYIHKNAVSRFGRRLRELINIPGLFEPEEPEAPPVVKPPRPTRADFLDSDSPLTGARCFWLFGLPQTAPFQTAQSAFRRMLKEHHPDIAFSRGEMAQAVAHQRTKRLISAWEYLQREYGSKV